MLVDELSQRNTHLFFDHARVIDVSAYAVELCSLIPLAPEASEPARATPADCGGDSNGLNICHCRRAAEKADVGGERGLEAGLSLLPFYALDECGFLSTNVGSRSTVDVYVKRVARSTGVLSEEASSVGLIDSLLDVGCLLVELSSDVDVGSSRVHAAPGDETTLDEFVGISAENFAILASARFTLIGVDNKVTGPAIYIDHRTHSIPVNDLPWVLLPARLVHKTPLQATRKPSSAAPTKTRVLYTLNDPGISFQEDIFSAMPVATGLSQR